MVLRQIQTIFRHKFKIPYDESTGKAVLPKWIGVRPICEHADACPSLKYLSKAQLKLFKALQACDMKTVLNTDWFLVYQTLQTFETLGLITIPEQIESSYQLEQYTIKILPERTCSCKLVR